MATLRSIFAAAGRFISFKIWFLAPDLLVGQAPGVEIVLRGRRVISISARSTFSGHINLEQLFFSRHSESGGKIMLLIWQGRCFLSN